MTYATFGSFQHEANECNIVRIDVRSTRSPRGKKLSTDFTYFLYGELLGNGSDLKTRMANLVSAYDNDGSNFTLFTDDGVPTLHQLHNTGDCLSGVRVLQRSWPRGDAAELATVRTFAVTLWARYATTEDQLVFWKERLRYIGNCGPRYEVVQTYGGPYYQQTAVATTQRIIQSGQAVGFLGYQLPPGPLFPGIEHQDMRDVTLIGGTNQGLVATGFGTAWTYHMTSLTPLEAAPITV